MTVDVCRLMAGTIIAAGPDMTESIRTGWLRKVIERFSDDTVLVDADSKRRRVHVEVCLYDVRQ